MRKLISLAVLFLIAAPAFASPALNVPEPEVLSMPGIGAVAFLVSRRAKK